MTLYPSPAILRDLVDADLRAAGYAPGPPDEDLWGRPVLVWIRRYGPREHRVSIGYGEHGEVAVSDLVTGTGESLGPGLGVDPHVVEWQERVVERVAIALRAAAAALGPAS